jgi:hypothetical protein
MKYITGLILCATIPALTGCHSRTIDDALKAMGGPTATEIFRLRTECAKLGKQLQEDHQHGLLGPGLASWKESQYTTDYDPRSNRCYVVLALNAPTPTFGGGSGSGRLLYGGQSREQLAVAVKATAPEKTVEFGFIGRPPEDHWSEPAAEHAAYTKAEAFIDDHMRDN